MHTGANAHTAGLGTYLVGFALALILTVIPFGLVYLHVWPADKTLWVIGLAAVLQVAVHLRFFLHITFKRTPLENLLALGFAALLILIMVGGSLWIMYNLHYRMMV